MKQLRDQINGDFSNMIDFGNKVCPLDFPPARRMLACNDCIVLAQSAHHHVFCGWAGRANAEGRVYHLEGVEREGGCPRRKLSVGPCRVWHSENYWTVVIRFNFERGAQC